MARKKDTHNGKFSFVGYLKFISVNLLDENLNKFNIGGAKVAIDIARVGRDWKKVNL